MKLSDPRKDIDDTFGKGFALSMVHRGVAESLTNEAIVKMYDTGISGMELKYGLDRSLNRQKISSEEERAPPVRGRLQTIT